MCEYLAELFIDNKVGTLIGGGGVAVYDHKLVPVIVIYKTRGGVDGKRGAADNEHIAFRKHFNSAHNDLLVKPLLIKHDIGADNAAASAAGDTLGLLDYILGVWSAAFGAIDSMYRSVQLIDVFAARRLMQTVDILRDYGA